jgi:hypothetical protein
MSRERTLVDNIHPKYVAGATVKLIEPDGRGSHLAEVVALKPGVRAPRNGSFRPGRRVRVNDSHLTTPA